jgi:DNA-binding winged helix-turn-helix (wHTH) protein
MDATVGIPVIYSFGPFRLDASKHVLTKEGMRVGLTPAPMAVLLALIGRAGQLVAKVELEKKVWGQRIGGNSLPQQIHVLRKTLGETPVDNEYIETIPRQGYRFVAQVAIAKNEPAGASAELPAQENPDLPARVGNDVHEDTMVVYEVASGDPAAESDETPLEDFMEAVGRIDMANKEEWANVIDVPEWVEREVEKAAGRAAMAVTSKTSRPLKLKSRTGTNRKGRKPHQRPKKGSR